MPKFQRGQHYYLVRYLDDECLVPEIKTLIFVGLNIFPDESDHDMWFFQDAASFIRSGPVQPVLQYDASGDTERRADVQLWEFPEAQLSDVLTGEALGRLLQGAAQ